MTAASTADRWLESRADAEIRRLALTLLPRTATLAGAVMESVLAQVPELVPPGDEAALATAVRSTEQNIAAMLSLLAFGGEDVQVPEATRELLDHAVRNGGDATTLMGAYRAGHVRLWELWSDHVAADMSDHEVEHIVLRETSAHFFGFIDEACRQLLEQYRRDYTGAPAGHRRRHELIDALLAGGTVDLEAARRSLGYELGGHHVALVLRPLTVHADLRGALEAVGSRGGRPQVLSRALDDGSWWAWLGWPAAPDAYQYAAMAQTPLDGVAVGMGEPEQGAEGFCRSHQQAADAEQLVAMGSAPAAGVAAHADVALTALLCRDRPRAERFAAAQLGLLGAADEAAARLRQTVATYLASGMSKVAAAEALHVHKKTVTYRLGRAEELLGRRVSDASAELDAALRIHRALFGP